MTTVHIGLPSLQGALSEHAEHFDLLEVRPIDTAIPKASKLGAWRNKVPPAFVFSVVLPKVVSLLRPTEAAAQALTETLAAADALQARCLLLQTPPEVTPTELSAKRITELRARLPRDVVHVAWEPRGPWEPEHAQRVASAAGLLLVVDATQEAPAPGSILYTRVRAIGNAARGITQRVETLRQRIERRREVFVVLESPDPLRYAKALHAPLEPSAPRRSHSPGAMLPLQAEDEEQ